MPRRARPIQPPDPNLAELEKILAAADALIRRRLAAKNIRAVHLIFAKLDFVDDSPYALCS